MIFVSICIYLIPIWRPNNIIYTSDQAAPYQTRSAYGRYRDSWRPWQSQQDARNTYNVERGSLCFWLENVHNFQFKKYQIGTYVVTVNNPKILSKKK